MRNRMANEFSTFFDIFALIFSSSSSSSSGGGVIKSAMFYAESAVTTYCDYQCFYCRKRHYFASPFMYIDGYYLMRMAEMIVCL